MDRIINSENLLAYELISNDLRFIMKSENLGFQSTECLKYINNGEDILSFELRSYHAAMPIYAVILNFMFETGGIW